MVAHDGVGEDFDAGEAFQATHDPAEGFFLDLAEEHFAAGGAAHDVVGIGPAVGPEDSDASRAFSEPESARVGTSGKVCFPDRVDLL